MKMNFKNVVYYNNILKIVSVKESLKVHLILIIIIDK